MCTKLIKTMQDRPVSMKNAGVGVGLPDKGRCNLVIEDGVCVIYAAASDIGQGCATVILSGCGTGNRTSTFKNPQRCLQYRECTRFRYNFWFKTTLLTGEAVRGAAVKLADAMKEVDNDLEKLNGKNYFYEYYEPTDKLGADVPYPKSHIAYGFATHVVILDKKRKSNRSVCGTRLWKGSESNLYSGTD